jgi:hypothetical protein
VSGQPRNTAFTLSTYAAPSALWDGSTPIAVAAVNSRPIHVRDFDAFAIQISTQASSTLAGSFALQGSNDFDPANIDSAVLPTSTAVQFNWTTISFWDVGTGAQASTKAIVSGANSVMLAERACVYRWLQLVFSGGSGSGNPVIRFQGKGFT